MSRRDVKKGAATLSYEGYGYDPMSRLTSVSREDGTSDSFTRRERRGQISTFDIKRGGKEGVRSEWKNGVGPHS
jgi:hypothetical protein